MKPHLLASLLLGLLACGERSRPDPIPTPTPTTADAALPVATADAARSGDCVADDRHCCMADGTLVVPGGCQPSYPDNVQPAVDRADDGSCQPIECYLRCLPETARIATPDGDRAVTDLQVGDPVWTADAAGRRRQARVAAVVARPVLEPHVVVELALADGRVVRASSGHPDSHGAPIGALAIGDTIDGTTVRAIARVAYPGAHTWDLLPDGPTGLYWADGVLLGSTLAP